MKTKNELILRCNELTDKIIWRLTHSSTFKFNNGQIVITQETFRELMECADEFNRSTFLIKGFEENETGK